MKPVKLFLYALFLTKCVFVLLSSSISHANKIQKKTIALKPLESIGFPTPGVARADKLLHQVFQTLPGIDVFPLKKIRRFVARGEGARLLLCGTEDDCIHEFGQILGVPLVVAGDITPVGRGFTIYLKLYDMNQKKVIRSVSGVVSGKEKEHRESLLELSYRLVAPEKHTGFLKVNVDVKGAEIYINGEKKGTSPTDLLELKAGTHNIRVTHPSYHDFLRFFDLQFGRTITIEANLKRYPVLSSTMKAKGLEEFEEDGRKKIYKPLPWYKKWYVGVAIGVGAAILAGTATGIGVALSKDSRLKRDLTVTLRP